MVVRNGDEVWVQSADQPADDDDAKVHVDLSRLRREVDPVAEWRQMFEENARLMRDQYWRDDFDGTDEADDAPTLAVVPPPAAPPAPPPAPAPPPPAARDDDSGEIY